MPNSVRICFAGLLYFVLTGLSTQIKAQVLVEDFDTGFTPSLGWAGDLQAFAGEGGRLVLRDARPMPTSTAKVFLPARTQGESCWSLNVDQRFSPSTSNRVRWWLAADRPLDQVGVQGYYLQLGGISGDGDAIELFYNNGASATAIASGRSGFAASDPLTLNLEVCVTASNNWNFRALAAGVVLDSASGLGPQPLAGEFSGFEVAFTSTRNGLLSFDELRIDPIFVDQTAPSLVLAKALSAQTVLLLASETLAPSALTDFRVASQVPVSLRQNRDSIILTLAQVLISGVETPISIAGLTDLTGNRSAAISTSVRFTAPRQLQVYDLLITEIMADPSPVVGLPEIEFLELYNASSAPIRLSDVRLDNLRTEITLPDQLLLPGAYIALTRDVTADPRFVQHPSLPTLTNSGGTLVLRSGGRVIDEVVYDDAYYKSGRGDGGYSLERIDLTKPCITGRQNWTSSDALSGGTPGAVNASAEILPVAPLQIVSAELINSSTFKVVSNRVLSNDGQDAFELSSSRSYTLIPERLSGQYQIVLDQALQSGEVVNLSLSPRASSCVGGTALSTAGIVLGIPEASAPGDWELNEILYDPLTGQKRWVELANVSDKLLSLNKLLLATSDKDGSVGQAFVPSQNLLVPGGGLIVLAADPAQVLQQYPDARASAIIAATVPTLNDESCILLVDPVEEEVYFNVCYSKEWHNKAYAKTDGVSLERIDLLGPANEASNWTSASSTSGFGTPTLPNSQARSRDQNVKTRFILANQRLSPDGDGFEDLLLVDYVFDEPGVLVQFSIVDLQGRELYAPTEEISAGSAGTWTWDGTNQDGEVVPVGTYVLRAEYWSPDMTAKREFLAFSVLKRI